MEEKSGKVTGFQVETEAEVTLCCVVVEAAKGTETIVMKKKRGRPRKYNVDGETVVAESPPPVSVASPCESSCKRGRGRPKGSGRLQQLASLGGVAADTAGGRFTPHVMNVLIGEDIVSKISSFSLSGSRAVCVLSATGVVSCVIIRQPGSSCILRYEGRFEILSLSGSYLYSGNSETNRKREMLSVSLAKPDGRVFGGNVAGSLIAAGPVQLIIGSFKQNISKEIRRWRSADSSKALRKVGNSDFFRSAVQMRKLNYVDENCSTPRTAILGKSNVEDGNANGENPSCLNQPFVHYVNQIAAELSPPTSDPENSPEIHANIPDA